MCDRCHSTGMLPDTPISDYRFGAPGWTRCDCPIREPPPPYEPPCNTFLTQHQSRMLALIEAKK